jgi:hypothetical protein
MIYISIFLIIICLFYYINKNIYLFENFNNNNNIIPLNLYQTWRTLELPPKMQECVNKLKHDNPEFKYYLYDDSMCYDFIKKHFSKNVLDAYNSLIPGAYKADLFRYCILYINGGIYLDIKYCTINNFKLKTLTDNEYYVKDINQSGGGIYNALLICKPNSIILKNCIKNIVHNVQNKYYGNNPLEPTGPLLMKNEFTNEEIKNLKLKLAIIKNNLYILYNNLPILIIYKEYRQEQNNMYKNTRTKGYADLWYKRNIYKNSIEIDILS